MLRRGRPKAVRRLVEEAAPKGRRLIISSGRDSTQGLALGQSNQLGSIEGFEKLVRGGEHMALGQEEGFVETLTLTVVPSLLLSHEIESSSEIRVDPVFMKGKQCDVIQHKVADRSWQGRAFQVSRIDTKDEAPMRTQQVLVQLGSPICNCDVMLISH